MSDQPDYLTPPGYRDSFAPEEAQGSSGEIAKLRELATHSRPFTRFSDFIADFEPIAYALDGVMRFGSLYTLTAAPGQEKRRSTSSWRSQSSPASASAFSVETSSKAESCTSLLRTQTTFA